MSFTGLSLSRVRLFRRRLCTGSRLRSVYAAAVASGRLRPDTTQQAAVDALERLEGEAASVYLCGQVGSGKSMLMDLMYESSSLRPRVRRHFHEFMLDVHARLHAVHEARPRTVVLTEHGLPIFKFGDVTTAALVAPAQLTKGVNDAAVHSDTAPSPPPPPPPDPLTLVLDELASDGLRLLCLDELQVTDVADAMLVRSLFEGLFARGVRVAFTSNRPPEELYERGLNRRYFLPFVSLVREQCAVVDVGQGAAARPHERRGGRLRPRGLERRHAAAGCALAPSLPPLATVPHGRHGPRSRRAGLDYRRLPPPAVANELDALAPRARGWLYAREAALLAAWGGLGPPRTRTLPVAFGRSLDLRVRTRTARADLGGDGGEDGSNGGGDAALCTFEELCGAQPGGAALGAPDFLALASSVRALYLRGVPVLTQKQRNEARRFVTLIDALYEARGVALHLSAAAPLEELLQPLLEPSGAGVVAEGAEIAVDGLAPGALERAESTPSFEQAPVGQKYTVDGELSSFFTAVDERFMARRTLSRLVEMTAPAPSVPSSYTDT